MKNLVALALLAFSSVAVFAQAPYKQDNTPAKNNFTAAVTLEHNAYINTTAYQQLQADYSVVALNNNWSEKKLMTGLELGWFITSDWKLELGGGFNFQNNPGYEAMEGTGSSLNGGVVDYSAVGEETNFNYRVFLGGDRYFRIKNVQNLTWYVGVRANFAYGQDLFKMADGSMMGRSVAETWNLGGSAILGIDYFVFKGVYLGASVAPATYTYNMVTYVPQEGLGALSADSHTVSAFAAPTFKVGFVFGK